MVRTPSRGNSLTVLFELVFHMMYEVIEVSGLWLVISAAMKDESCLIWFSRSLYAPKHALIWELEMLYVPCGVMFEREEPTDLRLRLDVSAYLAAKVLASSADVLAAFGS